MERWDIAKGMRCRRSGWRGINVSGEQKSKRGLTRKRACVECVPLERYDKCVSELGSGWGKKTEYTELE